MHNKTTRDNARRHPNLVDKWIIMAFKSWGIVLSALGALLGLYMYRYGQEPSSLREGLATSMRRSMMRLFRDVSRFKSKVRLHQGNPMALIPLIFQSEDELFRKRRARSKDSGEQYQHHDMTDRFPADFTMTLEELAEMNGATESTPIYVAVRGLIFDVSAGRDVYGPGKSYYPLVAKEATAMYATGCLGEDDCKDKMPTYVITPDDIVEIEKWVDFYATHAKYKYVGRLLNYDFMDEIVAMELKGTPSNEEDGSDQIN